MSAPKEHHDQTSVMIPDVSMKELLEVIPPHCFQRSALRSFSYLIWDLFVIGFIYKVTTYLESYILLMPYSSLRGPLWVALWANYSFWVGLFGMGLWAIAHECGHNAFSTWKSLDNSVGWVLHSALGVPYYSWKISHAMHHASTCNLSEDQVYVPRTRGEQGAPAFKPSSENVSGTSVSCTVQQELWEALGDSPLYEFLRCVGFLLAGLPAYLVYNVSGQRRYPKWTNHFSSSSVLFSPHHSRQVLLSNFGIFLWVLSIVAGCMYWSLPVVLRVYLIPYLWVNHWLVLITFLQHTDPLVPHYRADTFTFQRGALSTLDRSLLGGLGPTMGWIAGHATNGVSETHVLHHVYSKIPHYHAWEASAALRKKLEGIGIHRQGAPSGWGEVYRVFRECKFVEDVGSIVFYKNAYGLAAAKPIFQQEQRNEDGQVMGSG